MLRGLFAPTAARLMAFQMLIGMQTDVLAAADLQAVLMRHCAPSSLAACRRLKEVSVWACTGECPAVVLAALPRTLVSLSLTMGGNGFEVHALKPDVPCMSRPSAPPALLRV